MKAVFFAACLALLSPAAWAEDGTGIDMTTALHDDRGNVLPDDSEAIPVPGKPGERDCSKCGPSTVGKIIARALLAPLPSEQTVPGDQKWARGVLAQRIENDPHARLTAAEIVVIKRLVGIAYSPWIVAQVFPLLDPNAKPPSIQ